MYVEFDKETNDFVIKLPEDLKTYFMDLKNDLINEFGFESVNKFTIERINLYIKDWFSKRGIELSENKQ